MKDISPLQGSEKQIAWATKIRQEALSDGERNLAKMRKEVNQPHWIAEVENCFYEVMNRAEKLQAEWWINHRMAWTRMEKGKPIVSFAYHGDVIQREMKDYLLPRKRELERLGPPQEEANRE